MDYTVDLTDYSETGIKKLLAEIEKVSSIKWCNGQSPTGYFPAMSFLASEKDFLVQASQKHDNVVLTRDEFISKMAELYPKKQDIRDYCKEHRCWAAMDENLLWAWFSNSRKPHIDGTQWFCDDPWKGSSWDHLNSKSFTFPSVPWDKSLVAPDGSMPLWDKKEEKYKIGCYVDWTKIPVIYDFAVVDQYGGLRVGNSWLPGYPKRDDHGGWDTVGRWSGRGEFDGAVTCTLPKGKDSLIYRPKARISPKAVLHRGDPVFVWDDGDDENIPAIVMHFHHKGAGNECWTCDREKYGEVGVHWDHYHPFDISLIGVPKDEWPK